MVDGSAPPASLPALLGRTLVLGTLLALAAGALRTCVRVTRLDSWNAPILWRALAAEVNAMLPIALGALLAWLLLFAWSAKLTRTERLRALSATAVVALPLALWMVLWVNRALLRRPLSIEGALGNLVLAAGLFASLFLAAAQLRSWRERAERGAGIWLAVLALPVALNVVAARSRPPGPSAIVILIDVLGARHMSCYGYERETTPHLDRLAADGVLFEQAIAQSSFTKTSVASLFTGLWPHHHGVYVGAGPLQDGRFAADMLGTELPTLAESLQSAGYLTAGWMTNHQCGEVMGFGQGFGVYDDRELDVDSLSSAFLDWLADWRSAGPFFAYLHVLDLHGPYQPGPPFDERFGRYADMEPLGWEAWNDYKLGIRSGERVPPAEEIEQLRAWYDGQLAWIDQQLGRLLERLRETGVYDESLIVLLADHGDGFMQHASVGHSNTPYEELIHVPLIVKLPGSRSAGRRVAEQVALVDLAPTLEGLLGAQPWLARTGDGTPLEALFEDRAAPEREWIYSEHKHRKSVRSERWKYIRELEVEQLFDLRADPLETTNVLAQHPDVARECAARIEHVLAEHAERENETLELDEETVQRLREMGYL